MHLDTFIYNYAFIMCISSTYASYHIMHLFICISSDMHLYASKCIPFYILNCIYPLLCFVYCFEHFNYCWNSLQTDRRTDGQTDRPTDQPTDRPTVRRTNQLMDQPTDGRTDWRMDGPTERRTMSHIELLSQLKIYCQSVNTLINEFQQ